MNLLHEPTARPGATADTTRPALGTAALKLLRGHLAETLVMLGATGADDPLIPVLDALDLLLSALGGWLDNDAQRGSVELLQLQVAELRGDAARLGLPADAAEPADAATARRTWRLHRLYRHYALFVAEMLQVLHAVEAGGPTAAPAPMDWPEWRAALPAMVRTLTHDELLGWLALLGRQTPALLPRVLDALDTLLPPPRRARLDRALAAAAA